MSGNLETAGWGSRFPVLLSRLYQGELAQAYAGEALQELARIAQELSALPPGRVIWDIDDRTRQPPWGSDISPDITDLSNYFVTSTGKPLIPVLQDRLQALAMQGGVLRVV